MKPTRLVQRLTAPIGDGLVEAFSFGGGRVNGGLSPDAMRMLRPIFGFDYMGSAEFEWGAVPEALNRMARAPLTAGILALTDTDVASWGRKPAPLRTSTLYYLCQQAHEASVIARIRDLAKSESGFRLKEATHLAYVLREPADERYPSRVCGWLELDNGFAWFVDQEMWAKTSALFGVEALP